jgi:hypothetical protein
MRHALLRAWAAITLLLAATSVWASSPVPIMMGSSRDGLLHDLQRKVDRLVGPGRIDVQHDYMGAHPGDPDPWHWVNPSRPLEVTLVDRKSPHGVLGWYQENGVLPVIDGLGDGVVFDDWRRRGSRTLVRIPPAVTRFGFYVVREGGHGEEDDDDGSYLYFTNRMWNDLGPHGRGAEHSPYDGDMQMLVYDISRWAGSDTWLVACEYSDSGSHVGHDRNDSDNDYSDILFTVSGVGLTPTLGKTFGQLKALYR